MRNHLPIICQPISSISRNGREYVLFSGEYHERFEGDNCAAACHDVKMGGKTVCRIFVGDKINVNMNPIRWAGRMDSNHYNHIFHDHGSYPTMAEAFERAVERCEAIIAWRAALAG